MKSSLLTCLFLFVAIFAQDNPCVSDYLPPNQNITTATPIDVLFGANFTDLTVCAFQSGDLFRLNLNTTFTRVVRALVLFNESLGGIGATVSNSSQSILGSSTSGIVSAIVDNGKCGPLGCFLSISLSAPRANYAYNNYSLVVESWQCVEDPKDPQTNENNLPQVPFISFGSSFLYFTLCGLEADWFRLVVVTPQVISINVTMDGIDTINIEFFEKNDNFYNRVAFNNNGRIDFQASKTTYYIKFSPGSFVEGWGTYSFSVSPNGGYPGVNATTGQVTTAQPTTAQPTTGQMTTGQVTTGQSTTGMITTGMESNLNFSTTAGTRTLPSTTVAQPIAIVDSQYLPAFAQGIIITVGSCAIVCCVGGAFLFVVRHKRRQMKHIFKKEAEMYRDSLGSTDSPTLTRALSKRFLDSIPFSEIISDKQIGEGSSGVVYRAMWRGIPVAVKQLHTVLDDKDALQAFKSEARLMRSLRSHPNCVLFLGVTVPPDPICIVTEYLRNGSLYHYLQRESLSIEVKVRLMSGIASGILHLHSEGVVHRDLAARNILLTSDLTPKVADFGMSRKLTEATEKATTENKVGPLKWMAPESITDAEYSYASDAWMFGIVCWEILTGEMPYGSLPPLQAASKVITEDLRLEIPKICPDKLAALMKECWNKDPKGRPIFEEICNQLKDLYEELNGISDEDTPNSPKQSNDSSTTQDTSPSTSTAPFLSYSKSPQHLIGEANLEDSPITSEEE